MSLVTELVSGGIHTLDSLILNPISRGQWGASEGGVQQCALVFKAGSASGHKEELQGGG